MDDCADTIISALYDMLCNDFETDAVKAAAQEVACLPPSDDPATEFLRRRACDLLSQANFRCFSLANKGLTRSANRYGWFFKAPGRTEQVFGISSCALRLLRDAVHAVQLDNPTITHDAYSTLRIPKIPNPDRLIDQRQMCFDVFDVGRELISVHLIDTDRVAKTECLEMLKRVEASVRGMSRLFVRLREDELTVDSSTIDFFHHGFKACMLSLNIMMNAAFTSLH